MKDLSTDSTPMDDLHADVLPQGGDASEAQLRTMDAIVTSLDDIKVNVSSISNALTAITATNGGDTSASLAITNAYLASIKDTLHTLSLPDQATASNASTIPATESTLGSLAKTVVAISKKLDALLESGHKFDLTVTGNTSALQNITSFIVAIANSTVAKNVSKNAAKISDALTKLTPGITDLANALQVSEERNGSSYSRTTINTGLLSSLQSLLNVMSDTKRVQLMRANSKVFCAALVALGDAINSAISELSVSKRKQATLDSLAKFINDLHPVLIKASILVGTIGLVTTGLAFAFKFIDLTTVAKATVSFPAICCGISLGLLAIAEASDSIDIKKFDKIAIGVGILSTATAILALLPLDAVIKGVAGTLLASTILVAGLIAVNKLAGPVFTNFNKNITYFALGVATMGIALYAMSYMFKETPWSAIARGTLVLLATSTVLAVAMKLMPTEEIKGFGWSVLALTASLLVLGYALPYFEEQTKDLEPATWLKAGAVLAALTASIAAINASTRPGADGKSAALNILAMTAAIAVMPAVLKQYRQIDWEDMAKPGIVLAALTTAIVLVGRLGPQTYVGVAAIVAMAGAVAILAYVLPKFEDISWESLGKSALAITEVGLAIVAVGYFAPIALAGSAAMLIGAGAISVLATGVSKFEGISMDTVETAGHAVWTLAKAMAATFVFAPFAVSGAAAAADIGSALYNLGTGLQQANKVDFDSSITAADAIIDWSAATCKKLSDNLSKKDIENAKLAMSPIYDLGSALKNITDAVSDMANGTYNEYAIGSDGKPKIVAVRHIGPETYAAFAESLSAMITGITEPLANFGAGGGWFTKSDTEKGIDALKDIGSIIQPMLDVATNMDAIKKADFSLIGPRFRDFFGVNEDGSVQKNGLIAVLQGIGGDDPWLGDSDLENGIEAMEGIDAVVKPFVELAKNADSIQKADFKSFGKNLLDLQPAIKAYADFDAELPDQFKIATNLKAVTDSFISLDKYKNNLELMKDIAVSIDSIANTDISKLRTVKSEASKRLFEKLDALEKMLTKIEDNTSPDNQVSSTDVELNADGTPRQSFQLQAGQHVDIVTIAVQLNQIKNLLASKRTIPKT